HVRGSVAQRKHPRVGDDPGELLEVLLGEPELVTPILDSDDTRAGRNDLFEREALADAHVDDDAVRLRHRETNDLQPSRDEAPYERVPGRVLLRVLTGSFRWRVRCQTDRSARHSSPSTPASSFVRLRRWTISSEMRPSDTIWMATSTSRTPMSKAGRFPMAWPSSLLTPIQASSTPPMRPTRT